MQRRNMLQLLVGTVADGFAPQANSQENHQQCSQDRVAWVSNVLTRMQMIEPGMTRDALLTVFTTEGGLSTGLQRTFVSRDCPYFKVDVEFQAVGRSDRDEIGRVTLVEDSRDIITKISPPYLQFSIKD
jgi:hypothetical protein